jgi:hypothetical protein
MHIPVQKHRYNIKNRRHTYGHNKHTKNIKTLVLNGLGIEEVIAERNHKHYSRIIKV